MSLFQRNGNANSATRRWSSLLALLTACVGMFAYAVASATASGQPKVQEWDFRVLLDGDEIGYHRFRLEQNGAARDLKSDAKFDVKFLFFTAYRYRHSNRERWQGECLASITTETNTNGDVLTVSGEQTADNFVVNTVSGTDSLPRCVMTFAYWDQTILKQSRLLNAQTGELVDVAIEEQDAEILEVRGEARSARRYRLLSQGTHIDVWYAQDGEWLALESPTKGGRVLRYELI